MGVGNWDDSNDFPRKPSRRDGDPRSGSQGGRENRPDDEERRPRSRPRPADQGTADDVAPRSRSPRGADGRDDGRGERQPRPTPDDDRNGLREGRPRRDDRDGPSRPRRSDDDEPRPRRPRDENDAPPRVSRPRPDDENSRPRPQRDAAELSDSHDDATPARNRSRRDPVDEPDRSRRRDDDDATPARSRSRRDPIDEDDRPRYRDDADRPRSRSRYNDDVPARSRSRDDDLDDRPRSRRREDDDLPPRRRSRSERFDDDGEPRPRRRRPTWDDDDGFMGAINRLTGRVPRAPRPPMGIPDAKAAAATAKPPTGGINFVIIGLVLVALVVGIGIGYVRNKPVNVSGTSVPAQTTPATIGTPTLTATPAK